MLLQSVVIQAVVQKRDVVVERDGPAAGPSRRVLVQLLVVGEVVEDLVVVGLGVETRAAAVAEDQLLFGPVTQAQVCDVEVNLLQETPTALSFDPVVFTASPATPLPVSSSPAAPLGVCCSSSRVCVGGSAQSADGGFDEVHYALKPLRVKSGHFKRKNKNISCVQKTLVF